MKTFGSLIGKDSTHFVNLMVNHDGSVVGPFKTVNPTVQELHQASLVTVIDKVTGDCYVWKNRWPHGPQPGDLITSVHAFTVLVTYHINRAVG